MSKKNLLLGGILGVLLILAFIYNGPFEDWKNDLGKPSNFLASLDTSAVNRMEIGWQNTNVVIDKIDNNWKIDGTKDFYVDSMVMNIAIEALKSARDAKLTLVSENAEKKSEFETDEESGYKLKLKNGDELLFEFVIGKNGNEINSSYIAQCGSDDTYLVKSSLRTAFGHDAWYNKTILELDKEKISKIRFQYPSREFTIEKTGEEGTETNEWAGVLPYKFSIDQEKIDTILDVVSNMNAVSVPAQTFEGTGLEKNNIIVQITGEDIDLLYKSL